MPLENRLSSALPSEISDIKLSGKDQVLSFVPDEADRRHTAIHWQWTNQSPTVCSWSPKTFVADIPSSKDVVIRFAIAGRMGSEFDLVLVDVEGHSFAIPVGAQITTLRQDGKFTEQFVLIEWSQLALPDDFKAHAIRGLAFQARSPEGDIVLSAFGIYDLSVWRQTGVAVGVYRGNGDQAQPLENWFGLKPQFIHSFEDIVEPPERSLARWQQIAAEGQIPIVTLEVWVMFAEKPWSLVEQEKKRFADRYGVELYERILESQRVPVVPTLGDKAPSPILRDIAAGRLDAVLRTRAQALKAFGSPIIERPLHEYTGFWYPWSIATENDAITFVAAWKHLRRLYREEGAQNVLFAWSPHAKSPWGYANIEDHFQAIASEVDLVSLDAYGLPYDCRDISEMMTGLVRRLEKYGVPIMIGETGSMGRSRQDDPDQKEKRFFFSSVDRFLRSTPLIQSVIYFDVMKKELGTPDERHFSPIPEQMTALQQDSFYRRNLTLQELKCPKTGDVHCESMHPFKTQPCHEVPKSVSGPTSALEVPAQAVEFQRDREGEHSLFPAYTLWVGTTPSDGRLLTQQGDAEWWSAVMRFDPPLDVAGKKIRIRIRGKSGGEYFAVHVVTGNQGAYVVSDKFRAGPMTGSEETIEVPISPNLPPVVELGIDYGRQTAINWALNPQGAELFLSAIDVVD